MVTEHIVINNHEYNVNEHLVINNHEYHVNMTEKT